LHRKIETRMEVSTRTHYLNQLFSYERKTEIADSKLEIIPFRFVQTIGALEIESFQEELSEADFFPVSDNLILENKSFTYMVFNPLGRVKSDQAIILLHGLNERTWEKYLTWAEYLVITTGKPVILFPIAFHMNRSPRSWSDPREASSWVIQRKLEVLDLCNSTFANVALSCRISKNPLRFYASGRESVYNLWQLVHDIKSGVHPLFKEDTSINLLAYSIGAFLSQVLLLANPGNLFTDSRLFMFCGGSIFSEMDGRARDIMDKEAFERMEYYFTHSFIERTSIPETFKNDFLEHAFKAMIRPDILKLFRENFFEKASDRIRAVSLKQDTVIPTTGISLALGRAACKILKEIDFPFSYSHQVPFPMRGKVNPVEVNQAFASVFNQAASFL